MMARRDFARGMVGLIAGAGGLLLSGCGLFDSKASFRYRMSVKGAHPSSAVYEILASKNNNIVKLPDERAGGSIIRGEALMVETPSGPVFLLLQSANGSDELRSAIVHALAPGAVTYPVSNYVATVRALGASDGTKAELPRTEWPMMVRFRDLNDPKSIERVDPAAAGVRRILLETTKDDVTVGIEKRLGWLSAHRGSMVKRDPSSFDSDPPFGVSISEIDFSKGVQ